MASRLDPHPLDEVQEILPKIVKAQHSQLQQAQCHQGPRWVHPVHGHIDQHLHQLQGKCSFVQHEPVDHGLLSSQHQHTLRANVHFLVSQGPLPRDDQETDILVTNSTDQHPICDVSYHKHGHQLISLMPHHTLENLIVLQGQGDQVQVFTEEELVNVQQAHLQSLHVSSRLASDIQLTSTNAEIPKDTNTKADPIETPPHPDMALVALITVLDDMHGMFTGHPDEKSQNAEEVNPASPVGGMLIQQRKDDPDHAVDTKFNVHVIDTKNSPVLKDKPGGGRRLLTTPE